uniref:Uncharacterized protein n=1 Tax=Anguilla anguilla TaxID=7936 RepID=A0A0E9RZY5_ANGAN
MSLVFCLNQMGLGSDCSFSAQILKVI